MGCHTCNCGGGHCSAHEKQSWKKWGRPALSVAVLMVYWIVESLCPSWGGERGWWRLAVYLVAWLPVAIPVATEAWEAMREKDVFNEFTLMLMASAGAFYLGEYPEAVAVMVFYSLGEFLQDGAVDKAKSHIRALLDMRPRVVHVRRGEDVCTVAPEEVDTGEEIEVSIGGQVPLDGMLLSAGASFNTAALTGESMPRYVGEGEEVLAGMIPLEHAVRVRTTRGYSDSALSRILDMVQHAVARKAPTERFIRKFARVYTPCVTGLAVLLVAVPWICSLCLACYFFDFDIWFYRALVFLVISCPCALVVSVPLSYFGGIGAASRSGILFKGGHSLDAMARVEAVLFDKTGTLTQGVFRVQEVCPSEGVSAVRLLSLAAGAEQGSTHPVARAIVSYADSLGASPVVMSDVTEVAGRGVTARMTSGEEVRAGRLSWLRSCGIDCPQELDGRSDTLVAVAQGLQYQGCVLLADEPKEDACRVAPDLHELGVNHLEILSGDKTTLVKALAEKLGIACGRGDLMPEDKVRCVEELRRNARKTVAFVGDGLNDAPVLAVSDVGIAMGGLGSDVAIETADVVIQTDRPSKVADAIRIGRRTHAVVRQNILTAVGAKLLVLLLGACGVATLWEAVFADVGVTLLAVLNAMRLLKTRK